MNEQVICCRCNCPLETKRVGFAYLGQMFDTDLPACPQCGQVYIPEELARGKMSEVEMALEDK